MLVQLEDRVTPAVISIADAAIVEGNAGTQTLSFTVTSDVAAGAGGITFNFDTADGSAAAGTDYVAVVAGAGTITAGNTTTTVDVTINGDGVVELNEDFTVTLSNPSAGDSIGDGTATGAITNDDAATVSIAAASAVEGTGVVFTATLTAAVDTDVTVTLTPSKQGGDTATETTDFDTTAKTITITAGTTTGSATVATVADDVVELDETFTATLSGLNAGGRAVTIGTGTAAGTITNDDAATVSIANAAAVEGMGVVFTATLSKVVDVDVTVTLTPSKQGGDTATEATDFDTAAQIITITAGTTTGSATVATVADGVVELDESFTATLGGLTAGGRAVTIGTGTAAGTITNDDAATVSIANASALEGAGVVFTATLSAAVDTDVTVTLTPSKEAGDKATETADFATTPQTITILAGALTGTATVATVADGKVEADETFTATLSGLNAGGRNVTVGTGVATGTITNGDTATFSIAPASAIEGTAIQFTITLSSPVEVDTSVTVTTADLTAADGTDYTGLAAVTVMFPAGTTSKTVTVPTTADAVVEADETFTATLGGLNDGGLTGVVTISATNGSATGTITNDDAAALTIGDVTQNEDAGTMTFTVTLTGDVQGGFTVDFTTIDGTATVVPGNDYAAAAGTLTFAGTTGESKTITVTINADNVVELTEAFTVALSNVVPGDAGVDPADIVLPPAATGTIVNDDTAQFKITPAASATEGGIVQFTITLTNPVDVATSVTVTTADGTAMVGDNDYTPLAGQVVTFAPGVTSQVVSVQTTADNTVEADETFTITLGGLNDGGRAVTISAADATGTGTILNDDAAEFKITKNAAAVEGGPISFTITLTNPVDVATSVTVTTADGSAVAPGDYTALPGVVVNFAAGVTSQTVMVATLVDGLVEANETFTVTLGGLNNGGRPTVTISATDNVGTGTILNDDAATLAIGNVAQAEDGGAMTFTVTLTGDVQGGFTVQFKTADGTVLPATVADGDYNAALGTLAFNGTNGESKTFTVTINADNKVEAEETFFVTLFNVVPNDPQVSPAAIAVPGPATGTIQNDDATALTVLDVAQSEAAGSMTFTVRLSNPVQGGFTVNFSAMDGSAFAGEDYVLTPGTLTFAGTANEALTFQVAINNENLVEPTDEFFTVLLSNVVTLGAGVPAGKIDATDTAKGIIQNDDTATITLTASTSAEGTNLVYTVTLSNPVSKDVSIDFSTLAGVGVRPATPGADFTIIPPSKLTFAAKNQTVTVAVPIIDDRRVEGSEQFVSQIANDTTDASVDAFVSIGKAQDTATIVDNDTAVFSVALVESSRSEDNVTGLKGTVGVAVSGPGTGTAGLDLPITIGLTSKGIGATPATLGVDYKNVAPNTFTFAGDTPAAQQFTFDLVEDLNKEGDEAFQFDIAVTADPTGSQAALGTPAAVFTILSDDETVRTYDATEGGDYKFINDGKGNVQLFVGAKLLSTDAVGTQAILLNGTANTAQPVEGVETANVDYTNGSPVPTGGITFNANGPAVGERFFVTKGDFATILNTFTGPQSGTLTLTGATTDTLTYKAVDAVEINVTSVGSLTFGLPPAASTAVLEDTAAGDAFMQVRSDNGTFATTKFKAPTTLLSVQRGNEDDTLTLATLTDNLATLKAGSADARFKTITQTGVVTANGSVSYFGKDIAIQDGANLTANGGNVLLNATGSLTLGTTAVVGKSVTQTGGGNVVITAGDTATVGSNPTTATITFDGFVDGPGSLTTNSTGTLDFNKAIGSTTALADALFNSPIVADGGTAVTGGGTTGGALNVRANNITFNGTVTAAANPVVLTLTGGTATQAAAAAITTTKLYLNGSGTFTLDSNLNKLTSDAGDLFARLASGSVTVRDSQNVVIRFDPNNPGAAISVGGAAADTTVVTIISGLNFSAFDKAARDADTLAEINALVPLFDVGTGRVQIHPGVARRDGSNRDNGSTLIEFVAEAKANLVVIGRDSITTNDPLDNVAKDAFTIRPAVGSKLQVNGNRPVPADGKLFFPFDSLSLQLAGIDNTNLDRDPGEGNGTFTFTSLTGAAFQSLVFRSIESIGGIQFEGFVIQTGPALNSTKNTFAVRAQARLQSSGDDDGSALGTSVAGNGIITNPFVVTPSRGSPFSSFTAPKITFADVNGDAVPDMILANGAGDAPLVTIIDGNSLVTNTSLDITSLRPDDLVAQFFAYEETFFGGVNVAAADLDGDGRAEIVTGAGLGGGQRVRIFRINRGDPFTNATPFVPGFVDGKALAAPPRVAFVPPVIAGAAKSDFFAFDGSLSFRGGVNVAVGDVNGDAVPDIAIGAGVGGGPRIIVYSGKDGSVIRNFFAYEDSFRGGVLLDVGRFDADKFADILTAPGRGGSSRVRVFLGNDTDGMVPTQSPVSFFALTSPPSLLPSESTDRLGLSGVAFGTAAGFDGGRRSILVSTPGGARTKVLRFIAFDDGGTFRQPSAADGQDVYALLLAGKSIVAIDNFDLLRGGGSVGGFAGNSGGSFADS